MTSPPGNPTNALQALIANLRRTLGSAAVVTTDAGYSLALSADDIDVVRFEHLVSQGRRALDDGDPATAAAALDDALALRRGEPLAEFAFSEFADGERARLDELVLVAVEARVDARLQLGQHGEVVGELESLCAQHPLRERLWELRMLALYRGGRQAEALRVYGEARERLVDELGLEPGPALRELEGRVLAQDPTLDAPAVQVAPRGRPRRRPATFASGSRASSDAKPTSSGCSSRWPTIAWSRSSVPGGRGRRGWRSKSRRGCNRSSATAHGSSSWQRCATATAWRPRCTPRCGSASSPRANRNASRDPVVDQLARHLADRTLIVVLDNCEHVIAEAAALAETLTSRVPDLRLVATSREALARAG